MFTLVSLSYLGWQVPDHLLSVINIVYLCTYQLTVSTQIEWHRCNFRPGFFGAIAYHCNQVFAPKQWTFVQKIGKCCSNQECRSIWVDTVMLYCRLINKWTMKIISSAKQFSLATSLSDNNFIVILLFDNCFLTLFSKSSIITSEIIQNSKSIITTCDDNDFIQYISCDFMKFLKLPWEIMEIVLRNIY